MNINEIEKQLEESLQIATTLNKNKDWLQKKQKENFIKETKNKLQKQKKIIEINKKEIDKKQLAKILVDVIALTFMLNSLQRNKTKVNENRRKELVKNKNNKIKYKN